MWVKLKNGTEKNCTTPIEQKLFRSGVPTGWLCSFNFKENITSTVLDELLTEENIADLTFCNDAKEELFQITEYTKVSSAVIRYSETDTAVEIQLTKGV